MNARQQKIERERKEALRKHLRGLSGAADAASLSRSYGLAQPLVEQMIREASYVR